MNPDSLHVLGRAGACFIASDRRLAHSKGFSVGDSRRLEVAGIAGNDCQAVFQRRSCNQQVCAVVPKSRRQPSPSPRRSRIHDKNPVAVPGQHPVQPESQFTGERWIAWLLLRNATLYLPHGDNAYVQISCALGLHPTDSLRIPFTPAERRQHVGVQEKHHRSNGRAVIDSRLNSWSSCGISRSSSPRVGASDLSRRQSRSYSSAASTTTAGCPRRVTRCGSPASAALTRALNLFFASCRGHSRHYKLRLDVLARLYSNL